MDSEEFNAAKKYFDCVDLLSNINTGDFVIPRYSFYPFPLDQEREIKNIGAKLINSYTQHRYIADLQNYVVDLKDLTPRTWDNIKDIPENISLVVKGETNSKKGNWKKDMFASNKKDALEITSRLMDDSLISQQKIYYREYVPLVSLMDGINGMPVSKEFRFFVAYGKVLCGGYYWQNYIEDLNCVPNANDVPRDFLDKVISIVGNKSNFYVIDVAEIQSGEWIVIELNCGNCSGLSTINPKDLYSNLFDVLKEKGQI
jgi:hypothetical protein